MPRIKLAVQSVYHFSHAHIVNVNDVNMGAVVIDKKTKKPVHISQFFINQINSILYSTCHK